LQNKPFTSVDTIRGYYSPFGMDWRRQGGDRMVSSSLQPEGARATRSQMPWGAGARGGLSMVARLLRPLGGLQDALPEERETGPAITLTLEQLQPSDLPLHRAVAPLQGEPCGDRGQVFP
jgi:hypothetical protein